jgi:RNA polymerase sigma-70 factor (ECF subfamily)
VHFAELKRQHALLEPFDGPVQLVAFLTGGKGHLDRKDDIYRALVGTAQLASGESELALAVLWLGLWPALEGVSWRLRWLFDSADERASEIAYHFLHLVRRMDLARVQRFAATLTWSTEREALAGGLRRRRERAGAYESQPARYRPALSPETEVALLRRDLERVVGDAADLIIGVAIYGERQSEAAVRLGIEPEAARKRFQRALAKIRAERVPQQPSRPALSGCGLRKSGPEEDAE